MALERRIARLTKVLVDAEGISFDEAQARLRALTLEIYVGSDANSLAAHTAILTAVSVASRAFVGGVRIAGDIDQPVNASLPLVGRTLAEAVAEVGATSFSTTPRYRLVVGSEGTLAQEGDMRTWWHGWQAGVTNQAATSDDGSNPLSGIVAGALGVAAAFEAARGHASVEPMIVDLWPEEAHVAPPSFNEIFLPGALWLVGLGNLGQAFLWALASLPYSDPSQVSLILQDRDRITEENWATSILVREETYGALKTKVAEDWALACGFEVRRIDRRLLPGDRLEDDDPRLALCGVDKIKARSDMANIGFDCIIDAGLGRTAENFDRYRVTVFDANRRIDSHFHGASDWLPNGEVPSATSYQELEREIGNCGAIEIAGASVAAAFVSAIAAASAVARTIAIASNCSFPANEVQRLSARKVRRGQVVKPTFRSIRHAGRPVVAR